MFLLAGIDIGGTKCAVSLGLRQADGIEPIARRSFPTLPGPSANIERLLALLGELLAEQPVASPPLAAIGISCGGPLNSRSGLILSPPNLPGWDRVPIVTPFRERFGVPAALQNDANACALAEWQWGAGRGCASMIFLTFGTGMGAGLILDGRLYAGASDMAGEIGHVRMAPDGPTGYGKAGSFEGFCSGGGIAELGRREALRQFAAGGRPSFCASPDDVSGITAASIGEMAARGEADAQAIYGVAGRLLGRGLALLVDVLNPERIIIGSIYGRQRAILEPLVMEELRRKALPEALAACEVLPAGLGEQVGDYAGLSVALHALQGASGGRESRA